jgi:hypothetical protein
VKISTVILLVLAVAISNVVLTFCFALITDGQTNMHSCVFNTKSSSHALLFQYCYGRLRFVCKNISPTTPSSTGCPVLQSSFVTLREKMGLTLPYLIYRPTYLACDVPLWFFLAIGGGITTGFLKCRLRRRPPSGGCLKCGYDLRGNVSGICPECGRPIGSRFDARVHQRRVQNVADPRFRLRRVFFAESFSAGATEYFETERQCGRQRGPTSYSI